MFIELLEKLKKLNFKDPVVILTIAMVPLGIMAMGHFFKIGLALGTLQALGILFLVRKLPLWLKKSIEDNPFVADLTLSLGSTFMVSGLFGEGLTLGISAVFCAVLLSWALPRNETASRENTESQN